MDWDKLASFVAAAEEGSLTAAGERLGLSQSAVSRKVAALEQDLSCALFHRHARGLTPTGPGRVLLDVARDVSTKLREAERAIRDSGERPIGELTVTAPHALGAYWLVPRIGTFLTEHPLVDLRLVLDDRELDLHALEADVAVRPWMPTQPDIVQRKLFSMTSSLYASQAYLDRRGVPESEEDLDDLDVLSLAPQAPPWLRKVDWVCTLGRDAKRPRRPLARISSIVGLAEAASAGLGVVSLPDYMAVAYPGLVRVRPDWRGPLFDVHLAFVAELRSAKRVAVFNAFLTREAERWDDTLENASKSAP